MKKLDGFLSIVVLILVLLGGIYTYVNNSMSYFDDPAIQAQLQKKIEAIQLEKKMHVTVKKAETKNSTVSRGLASIPPANRSESVLTAVEAEAVAQNYYQNAKTACYQLGKDAACIENIDHVVTQFPESVWAAESMVLLTDYYYRTARVPQAREIVAILKTEFSNHAEIQSKVKIMEKALR